MAKSPVKNSKKRKIHHDFAQTHELNNPCYFLNKIDKINSKYNTHALSLNDILSLDREDYVSSIHFNYCFDIAWLINQYPPELRCKPITIVHGEKGEQKADLHKQAQTYQNIELVQAKLNIPFGTHHTKMIIILYQHGIRVIILTANMIFDDWDAKTQAIWLSPLFNMLSETSHKKSYNFGDDLVNYLNAYESTKVKTWCDIINKYNLETANVMVVGSTPGRHTQGNINKWGHLKLRQLLNTYFETDLKEDDKDLIIAQFSSIGSLGSSKDTWLCNEFLDSLTSTKDKNITGGLHSKSDILKLVFPSLSNVKSSFEGYIAGGSIPYSSQTHARQKYLTGFMHEWKSEALGRSRASPHIKTYARINADGSKLKWFLLTSANLSKAAWGTLEKKGTQLAIRSYELGVLFLPPSGDNHSAPYFPLMVKTKNGPEYSKIPAPLFYLPYDYPLTKYGPRETPWLVDVEYNDKDCLGRTWPPNL